MTKLLVVDDDLMVLATLAMSLQYAGYEVERADSGEWALQICDQHTLDLAILDIRMPGMSGIDLAKKLYTRKIPFIFLSAYGDDEIVREAALVGALGYLIKPADVTGMITAIEVALIRAEEKFTAMQTIENLTYAIEKNRDIDVAIGLLMGSNQINRVTAFENLRNYARSNRLKLIDVAKGVLSGEIKNILC